MDLEQKIDKIIEKLGDTEKRLDSLEKKETKLESAGIAEVEKLQERLDEAATNITKRVDVPITKETASSAKKSQMLKIIGIALIAAGAILLLLSSLSSSFGASGTVSFASSNTTSTSAQFFNGPIGQQLNQTFLTGLSNLSAQLAAIGAEQVAGNLQCIPASGSNPGFCVVVLPDQDYSLIPIPVPSSAGAPSLEQNGKPTFVYIGAQGCPYCAQERWAFTIALSQFGNFSKLFYDRSATNDGNISTFMYNFSAPLFNQFVTNEPLINNAPYGDSNPTPFFEGAYYSSSYINFEPFDEVGGSFFINSSGLPPFIRDSVLTPASAGFGIKNFGIGGVPFLDINNQYVFSGATLYPILFSSGYSDSTQPSHLALLNSIKNPTTDSFGETALASANVLIAEICNVIKNAAPVCSLSYVKSLENEVNNAYKPTSSSPSFGLLSYVYIGMIIAGAIALFFGMTKRRGIFF